MGGIKSQKIIFVAINNHHKTCRVGVLEQVC